MAIASPHQYSTEQLRHRRGWQRATLIFVALILITLVIAAFDLDRSVASMFYSPADGWFLDKKPLWQTLHKYGTVPGIIFSIGALLAWLASFYLDGLRSFRKPCLVIVLTAVLAAGLMVNAVLKQYWGRPRPSQTIEYGGQWEYRQIFEPGPPGQGASFPCGHATMGFVFLAAGSFYTRNRFVARSGIAAGILMGGALSAGRIVQGAHFLSDTFWACGIIVIVALLLDAYLPEPRKKAEQSKNRTRKKVLITLGALIAIAIMAGGFMTRRPYYSTRRYALPSPQVATIAIHMNYAAEKVTLIYSDSEKSSLLVDAHGFGWMNVDYKQKLKQQSNSDSDRLDLDLDIAARSYFAELDHALTLTLPTSALTKTEVLLNGEPVESR
jgi:membrane-associated PAP2 superfamily phosphatase